jgi:glycosyltransferase involved in cell wall biosynthesis
MRVLFVNSLRTVGGGERWLLEVSSALAGRGHQVAFAVREGGELSRLLGSTGMSALEVPMRGDGDVTSILRLSRWAREFRAELVSVNVQRAVRIGAPAARAAGVRAVVERRGLLFPLKPSAYNRFVYRRLVGRVIANCEAIARDLASTGLLTRDRVTVIPNGIDAARARTGGGPEARAELGIDCGAPVVAVVGRLVPDKGHAVALRAFAQVAEGLPSARLLVVGSGHLEDRLRALATELALGGSVLFLGHRDDVPRLLDAADVVLVTSYREGMPHVVLEAMAAGTPIVASGVAGIPEMIEDGSDGLLVPPGSHTAAAAAVERVLGDPALSAALAGSAGERVEREFALATMVDRVERCFELEMERGGLAA